MPELANRDKLESSLARELAKIGGANVRKLLSELGSPPSLSNVSDTFWTRYGAQLTSALNTALQAAYLQQAQVMMDETSVGVDWAQVNQAAADWAHTYTFDLVKGINQHTQDALQTVISKAIEQAQPLEVVRANIEAIAPQLFGPVRAATIATTELTRAAAQGEAGTVAQIMAQGVTMNAVWHTREDEKVCPVCGDLDGQTVAADALPPAHPNCRCSVGWVMA